MGQISQDFSHGDRNDWKDAGSPLWQVKINQEINIGLYVSELNHFFKSLVGIFTNIRLMEIHHDQLIMSVFIVIHNKNVYRPTPCLHCTLSEVQSEELKSVFVCTY